MPSSFRFPEQPFFALFHMFSHSFDLEIAFAQRVFAARTFSARQPRANGLAARSPSLHSSPHSRQVLTGAYHSKLSTKNSRSAWQVGQNIMCFSLLSKIGSQMWIDIIYFKSGWLYRLGWVPMVCGSPLLQNVNQYPDRCLVYPEQCSTTRL